MLTVLAASGLHGKVNYFTLKNPKPEDKRNACSSSLDNRQLHYTYDLYATQTEQTSNKIPIESKAK
jgi:hypothetical protein